MPNYILSLLFLLFSFVLCEERTFMLKSGNKITGEIMDIDESGNYAVYTSMGQVLFNQNEILLENVHIVTNDGDRVIGLLENEDNKTFHVTTDIGLMSILKMDVKHIDFNFTNTDYNKSFINKLNKSDQRYFYGDEQLIDVWFDPTGSVLSGGTIYISGLSAGYGITDKFQMSLRLWDYLNGDINIRPKFQIYDKGDINKSKALSIGAHLYLTGAIPHKWEYKTVTSYDYFYNYIGSGYDENNNYYSSHYVKDSTRHDNSEWKMITSNESSYEFYIAHTTSKLKGTGQGRINYNKGVSISKIAEYSDIIYRVWVGSDVDIRKSLKITALLAYDPYLPTISELIENEKQTTNNNFHLDFGVIYSWNNNFRVGLHLTSPFVAFYWKF